MTATTKGYDKIHSTAILVLRNPFEALVSNKVESLEALKGPVWDSQIYHNTFAWLIRSKSWICSAQSLKIVYYENFIKDIRQGI